MSGSALSRFVPLLPNIAAGGVCGGVSRGVGVIGVGVGVSVGVDIDVGVGGCCGGSSVGDDDGVCGFGGGGDVVLLVVMMVVGASNASNLVGVTGYGPTGPHKSKTALLLQYRVIRYPYTHQSAWTNVG